jgi:hypothetical protein
MAGFHEDVLEASDSIEARDFSNMSVGLCISFSRKTLYLMKQ